MRDSLVFSFMFGEIIDHFGLIEELWIFEIGVFDFDCDLFIGFNANGFVDLTEGSSTEFFYDFEFLGNDSINHIWERF